VEDLEGVEDLSEVTVEDMEGVEDLSEVTVEDMEGVEELSEVTVEDMEDMEDLSEVIVEDMEAGLGLRGRSLRGAARSSRVLVRREAAARLDAGRTATVGRHAS
jgi:hypothetical protein